MRVGALPAAFRAKWISRQWLHEVPLTEIVAWLEAKAKTGVLIDPKVYAGLFFVEQNK